MRTVRAQWTFPGSVHEAETLWYDTSRWATWVDGFGHVVTVEGPWPDPGGKVIWESRPAGRGRVVERVVSREPLEGQALDVEDESIRGRQTVAFMPGENHVQVDLALEYEIKKRSVLTPAIDVLFIRRAMTSSLARTLARFGVELGAEREAGGSRG
jgi:hypothetical protein